MSDPAPGHDVQKLSEELREQYGGPQNGEVTNLDEYRLASELHKPENLSDLAYSQALAAREQHRLKHSPGRGWLAWDERCWEDGKDVAWRAAKQLAHERVNLAIDANLEVAQLKRVVKRCGAREIGASLKLAETDKRLWLPAARLDSHPDLLPCGNGVIHLPDGELREHDPGLYYTKLACAEYDPDARSPLWERFLHDATDDDDEFATFIQVAAGMTATGHIGDEVVLFVYGEGNTGKTVMVESIRKTLGKYARTCEFASFLAARRDGSAPSPDIASLQGVRMAVASEVASGQRFNAGRLKMLTGGEQITARGLYRDPIEFTPGFTMWLTANEQPAIPGADTAVRRRMRVLPLDHVVPPERRDPKLKDALINDPAQRAAILAWIVRGAQQWYDHGLPQCAAVERATEGYLRANDPVAQWLSARCQLDEQATTPANKLLASYHHWCVESGLEKPTGQALGRALGKHDGLSSEHTRDGSVWHGIRLV